MDRLLAIQQNVSNVSTLSNGSVGGYETAMEGSSSSSMYFTMIDSYSDADITLSPEDNSAPSTPTINNGSRLISGTLPKVKFTSSTPLTILRPSVGSRLVELHDLTTPVKDEPPKPPSIMDSLHLEDTSGDPSIASQAHSSTNLPATPALKEKKAMSMILEEISEEPATSSIGSVVSSEPGEPTNEAIKNDNRNAGPFANILGTRGSLSVQFRQRRSIRKVPSPRITLARACKRNSIVPPMRRSVVPEINAAQTGKTRSTRASMSKFEVGKPTIVEVRQMISSLPPLSVAAIAPNAVKPISKTNRISLAAGAVPRKSPPKSKRLDNRKTINPVHMNLVKIPSRQPLQKVPVDPLPPTVDRSNCMLKPSFKCDICQRTFLQLSNLTNHQKMHKSLNPVCQYCDKTFKLTSALDEHLKLRCTKIPSLQRRKLLGSVQKENLKTTRSTNSTASSSSSSAAAAANDGGGASISIRNEITGIYRTPSKTLKCHLCKAQFLDCVSYALHKEAHGMA